jgi:hypothetical protein
MLTAATAGIGKLYHYEPFVRTYLQDVIINSRVHVSKIDNVNDPWDCRPFFDLELANPCLRRQWVQFLSLHMQALSAEQREALARLNPPWHEDTLVLSRAIESLTGNAAGNNIRNWRMYCLTAKPDSTLMWAHYSDKHKGICLEFATDSDPLGSAQQITYIRDRQAIAPALLASPRAFTEAMLLTKSQDWAYEMEYRLLCRDARVDSTSSVTCEDDYLPLSYGALTAVILGHNCSVSDATAVREIVEASAPQVSVKRALCAPHEYRISIRPSGAG